MFSFITPMIKLFPCLPVIWFVFMHLTYYALGSFFFSNYCPRPRLIAGNSRIFLSNIHINYVNYTRVYNG